MKRALTSLPSTLSPHLLQGVPLSTCLAGCGEHWASPSRYDASAYKNRRLCRTTEKFDIFLSHDWGTSRWLKLCALVLMFNVRAAAILSTLVGVLTGLLRVYQILPDGKWTELLPLLTFYGLLFFWQQIREILLRPLIVFLDRLSIVQHDDKLKEQGILGLAGFLDRSDILAVLWSTQYFKRLWCTYELATFLREPGHEKSVRIMPVKLAPTLLTICFAWQVIRIAHDAAHEYFLNSGSSDWLIVSGALLFFIFCGAPLYMYVGMGFIRDVQNLPEQLEQFKVQDAECFCCTNHHRHPTTGEELVCDRRLIFRTIRKWYGEPDEDDEAYLETFNQMVRSRLSRTIRQTVGGYTLPLNQYFFITLGSNAPVLTDYISRIAACPGPPGEHTELVRFVWATRWIIRWMNVSLQMLFGIWISIASWKLGVCLMKYFSRISLALTLPYLILPAVIAVAWLPIRLAFDYSADDSLLPAIPFLLLLIVTLGLFSAGASPKMIVPDVGEALKSPTVKGSRSAWEQEQVQEGLRNAAASTD
mmetsp:Transcript_40874/g.94896  ORF Transcript_40874/g.94896 Transcript_40874/m.94896 type:complete len:532 (+) Transcript_40874:28-1623(+)